MSDSLNKILSLVPYIINYSVILCLQLVTNVGLNSKIKLLFILITLTSSGIHNKSDFNLNILNHLWFAIAQKFKKLTKIPGFLEIFRWLTSTFILIALKYIWHKINTPETYQVHIVYHASLHDRTKGSLGLFEHNLMTRSLDL